MNSENEIISNERKTVESNNLNEDFFFTQSPNVHFSENMLYAWPLAVCRVDNGRKLNECLQQFLKERAECEEAYSSALERISKRLATFLAIESKGIQDVATVLSKNMLHRAHQARELAQNIRVDIIEATLSSTNQNHSKVLQQVTLDSNYVDDSLKQVIKHSEEFKELLEEKKRAIFKLSRQFQECSQSVRKTSSETIQLSKRLLRRIQEFYSLHSSVTRQTEAVSQAIHNYEVRMRGILKSLEDMDLKRMSCFKDALSRLMVYETSALRNMQYDLDSTIQVIQNLDEQQEIKEFLQRVKGRIHKKPYSFLRSHERSSAKTKEDEILSLTTLEAAARVAKTFLKNTPLDRAVRTAMSHLSTSPSVGAKIEKSKDDQLQVDVPNKIYEVHLSAPSEPLLKSLNAKVNSSHHLDGNPDNVQMKLLHHYKRIFSMIWKIECTDQSEEVVNEIKKLHISASFPIHRICIVNELDHYGHLKRFRLPSLISLKILGSIVKIVLDYADYYWDIETARHLMVSTQQFYAYKSFDERADNLHSDISSLCNDLFLKTTPNHEVVLYDDPVLNFPTFSNENESFENTIERKAEIHPTILGTQPGNMKCFYLYRLVYHCNIWSRVRFWEESLILTIAECHYARWLSDINAMSTKGANHEEKGFNNTIMTQLDSRSCSFSERLLSKFGACMLLFGIMESNVVALIEKVTSQLRLPSEFIHSFLVSVEKYTMKNHGNVSHSQHPPLSLEQDNTGFPLNNPHLTQNTSVAGDAAKTSPPHVQDN